MPQETGEHPVMRGGLSDKCATAYLSGSPSIECRIAFEKMEMTWSSKSR
jgi:hypothetical protein